jgi:hypothetical protein
MFKFHFSLPEKNPHVEDTPHQLISRGEIYIETENGFFPCIGWSDLTLSVILQWIGNINTLSNQNYKGQVITNYFMDGPYSFDIQKIEKNLIAIRFLKRTRKPDKIEEIPSVNIAFTTYYDALLVLVENLIDDANFQRFGKEQERINLIQSLTRLKALL